MAAQVAYQGAPGAFGEEACRTFLPGWEPLAQPSFAAVVEAVQAKVAERGMLPLRNSAAGDVPGVEALIRDSGLAVLSRHRLPVRMHLLGLAGASLATISRVASHPMALAQSHKWLDASGLETEEAANTAVAAQALVASGDRSRAVLASAFAAELYGLEILRRDVHDQEDNATTFAVLAREVGQ